RRVAQKPVGKLELRGEGRVLLHRVEGDAQYDRVLLLELAREVAVPATLESSSRRVGLGEEPEDDRLALEIGQGDLAAMVVLDAEQRSLRSDGQHGGPPQRVPGLSGRDRVPSRGRRLKPPRRRL